MKQQSDTILETLGLKKEIFVMGEFFARYSGHTWFGSKTSGPADNTGVDSIFPSASASSPGSEKTSFFTGPLNMVCLPSTNSSFFDHGLIKHDQIVSSVIKQPL